MLKQLGGEKWAVLDVKTPLCVGYAGVSLLLCRHGMDTETERAVDVVGKILTPLPAFSPMQKAASQHRMPTNNSLKRAPQVVLGNMASGTQTEALIEVFITLCHASCLKMQF